MPVKYRLVQKGNPGDAAAPKKFYAVPAPRNLTTVKEISRDILEKNILPLANKMKDQSND